MSFEATRAAWAYISERGDLFPTEVLVLLALADFENKDTGRLNPSVRGIAAKCHLSDSAVKRGLERLEVIGAIDRSRTKGGNSTTTNTYTLPLSTVDPVHPEPRPPRPARGSTVGARGSMVDDEPGSNQEKNPPPAESRNGSDPHHPDSGGGDTRTRVRTICNDAARADLDRTRAHDPGSISKPRRWLDRVSQRLAQDHAELIARMIDAGHTDAEISRAVDQADTGDGLELPPQPDPAAIARADYDLGRAIALGHIEDARTNAEPLDQYVAYMRPDDLTPDALRGYDEAIAQEANNAAA